MTVSLDYTAIGNQAAEAEDQTQMKEGGQGFERTVPAEGPALLRLLQYIELGKQKSNNPKYKDSEQVMLRFELHTPNHLIEIDTDEGKKKIPNVIDISLPKGGKTSKYGRLFTALNYNGKYNHFAQMVGAGAWLAEVTHNVVGEGADAKTYANLDKNKAWTFGAPQKVDPMSGEVTQYPVGELHGDPKVFLWENKGIDDATYIALWNELFIEGEYEAKEGKPAKSKNWIQDKIASGVTFADSRLAKIVKANPDGVNVDDLIEEAEASTPAEQATETPEVPAETPATPELPASEDIDPLLAAL